MNFLSALKAIGHVAELGVGEAVKYDSVISAVPVYGPLAVAVLNGVVAAEKLIPASTPNASAAKKTVATAIVSALAPSAMAAVKPSTAPGGINSAAVVISPPSATITETLGEVIDEVVAALNALDAALAKLPSATA